MLTPYWQMDVMTVETVFLYPIYVFLLIDIWIVRKKQTIFKSPYYTLVLCQGLADIFIILTIVSLLSARYFSIGNEFLYRLEPFGMASFLSNIGPLMFTVRIFGVFLISTQRYVAVCRHGGYLNRFLNGTRPMAFFAVHWIIPLLIYTPAFMTFSVVVISSFLTIGATVVVMNISILRALFSTRKSGQMSDVSLRQRSARYQEVRLAIHVFLLFVMSLITFCYYLVEFLLASQPEDSSRRVLRIYYPLISGNFSYINPITLLALNKDVQKMLNSQFCGKKGLADFSTILIFFPVTYARTYGFANKFIFSLGQFGAARFLVTFAPYLLITRGIGVTLISTQRYLTLCRPHSRIEHKIKYLAPRYVILFHWSLSLAIYTPAFILSNAHFEDERSLFIVSSETFNFISPLCVTTSFAFCTLLTVLLYAIIIKFLCSAKQIASSSKKSRQSRSNEYRLGVHVFLLTFIGILIFAYWLGEMLFGAREEQETLKELRQHYPLISGNFTFLNPIIYLVANREIQRVLRKNLKKKKSTVQSVSVVGTQKRVGLAMGIDKIRQNFLKITVIK
ncbi:unnamed protein product [Caenorhabditis sp. 36 PRJEB53466]|nr:unnamed protein product [Caenorhabditis sp. 36 PRJEB53466]